MIQKIVLSTIIFFLLVTVSFSQISQVLALNEENPLTAPVTSFARSISGNVVYRLIGFKHFFSKYIPAEDVTVKAVNRETHEIVTTTTDEHGNYVLGVDPGKYRVMVDNSTPKFWIPLRDNVNVVRKDKDNVDFKGLVLPF